MFTQNKIIIPVIVLAVIAVAAGTIVFVSQKSTSYSKEAINFEQVTPIEFTPEEKQILGESGVTFPEGEDPIVRNLQTVRSSDELDAIDADLKETDFSQLDAELKSIEKVFSN